MMTSHPKNLTAFALTFVLVLGASPQKAFGGQNSLDVITYNIRMLYCHLDGLNCGYPRKRTDAIDRLTKKDVPIPRRFGLKTKKRKPPPMTDTYKTIRKKLNKSGADVIVLNEAMVDKWADKKIVDHLERNSVYDTHTAFDRPWKVGYFQEGGIIILSKHTLKESGTKVLNERRADAARGVIHAEITKSGQHYDVFGVHIWPDNASGCKKKYQKHWAKQKSRLKKLANYVKDNEDSTTPTIIGGDFNIGTGSNTCGKWDTRRFTKTLSILDADPPRPKGRFARKPTIGKRTLDHIFVRNVPY